MKKLIAIAIMAALLTGCGEIKNTFKHIHSSFTGLNRKITLYNANGGIIQQWTTQAKVEDAGGTCFFIVSGKAVTISGTFVIEEQ